MNSKIYRCGWCGCPTDSRGWVLGKEDFERVVTLIEKYGDNHTYKTDGECCRDGVHFRVQVTRDMAIDAGDRSLEGQWIEW